MLKFAFLINFSQTIRQNKRPSTPKFVSLCSLNTCLPVVLSSSEFSLAICLTDWPERMVTNSVGLERPEKIKLQKYKRYQKGKKNMA